MSADNLIEPYEVQKINDVDYEVIRHIKPDALATSGTYSYPTSVTREVLDETEEYYIFEKDGKPSAELKQHCRVIAISILR